MPLRLGHFSAWITVDGDAELPIYDATTKDTHVSCWVPSHVDKIFSIQLSIGRAGFTDSSLIQARVFVDGKRVTKRVFKRSREGVKAKVDGVRTSATTKKMLMFATLEVTDDDQYLNDSQLDLGEIKVEFYSAKEVVRPVGSHHHRHGSNGGSGGDGARNFSASRAFMESTTKIHERSKKVVGHHIQLGEEVSTKLRNVVGSSSKSTSTKVLEKLATLSFRYRPLDLLQANGIAPPPPPPLQQQPKSQSRNLRPAANVVVDLTTIDDDDDDSARGAQEEEEEEEDEDTENKIKELLEQVDRLRKRGRKKTNRVKSESESGVGVKWEPGVNVKQEPGVKLEEGSGVGIERGLRRRLRRGASTGRNVHVGVVDLT